MLTQDEHDFFINNIYPHYPVIRKFLLHWSNDEHLSDDLAQSTMLDAIKYINAVRKSKKIKAYLITMAANNYKKHCQQFKAWIPIDEVADEIQVDEVLEEIVVKIETTKELDQLLDLLDEKHARILILHHYYGKSLKEIANIYGLNYNSIRSWYSRAIKKLRKFCNKNEDNILYIVEDESKS